MGTEVTTQSWGSRIMGSIKGVVFGLILFGGSFVLLSWNEHRAVETYRMLNEVKDRVIQISADAVSDAHDGEPVYLTGRTATDEVLRDPRFEIEANAIALRRVVEMYQWEEDTKSRVDKKTGGGTKKTVTYTYRKTWSDRVIPSASFHTPEGHENPVQMPFEDWMDRAEQVTVGSFQVSPGLVRNIDFYDRLSPRGATLPEGVRVEGDQLYSGVSPSSPSVGDVRIRFEVVSPGPVGIIAGQQGSALVPWTTSNGRSYSRIQKGTPLLEEMLLAARKEAKFLTWMIRGGGWLMMTIGLSLMLKPISVFADVLPLLGNIAETGLGLVSALIATTLTLITIAIAWIVVRPLVGVPLLLIAAGLIALHFVNQRKSVVVESGPQRHLP